MVGNFLLPSPMIAALFVDPDGPYARRPDVDAWDERRNALTYAGNLPVVAHPPCQRWGRYHSGGPNTLVPRRTGDDGGCFLHAVTTVRRTGGVLEHPEASKAWAHFGIPRPPRVGGWIECPSYPIMSRQGFRAWTCCVEQGNYGHPARKATWLYYVGVARPPELIWGPSAAGRRLDDGFHSAEERASGSGHGRKLSRREALLTPNLFAELLLGLAGNCRASPSLGVPWDDEG